MSDTDSANEYESADEDTEESNSKSEESVSKLEKSVLKLEENLLKIEQEISKDLKENVSLSGGDFEDNLKLTKPVLISDSSNIANTDCKMKGDFKEESVIVNEIQANKQNLGKSEEESINYSNNISANNTEDLLSGRTDVKTNINEIKSIDRRKTSSTSIQSKRVTLRLERKLQERSQSTTSTESVKFEPKKEEKTTSSWGFSSWGTSLLSTAATSVTTFTSQVSQGIGTVLETVESTLGAPPPADLAAILKEKREKELFEKTSDENSIEETSEQNKYDTNDESIETKNEDSKNPTTALLFTGVTSLTKVVGDTSSKVLMGGLDTLEMIGKKTIDILTEGDPGLRKKRSVFSGGITLSQVLREAKEKAEEDSTLSHEEQEDSVHYSQLFDEYQGLVHLEALEMLSNQCHSRVQRTLLMLSPDSEDKHIIEQISQICEDLPSADETPDTEVEQDFNASISEHLKALQLKINLGKIEKTRDTIKDWLSVCLKEQDDGIKKDAKEIYRQAISGLAEFTARCVEQFHKIGELVMIQNILEFDALMSATHLTGLTSVLCLEIGILATQYCQCLNTAADDSEDPDSVTPLITSVYLEASNSTTYVQDAFQLLVPVLQTILVE